jgi:hypothetical protein
MASTFFMKLPNFVALRKEKKKKIAQNPSINR